MSRIPGCPGFHFFRRQSLFEMRPAQVDHALVVSRRVLTHDGMDCSTDSLTYHGTLYDTRHEARPLRRAKRRRGDNARNPAVTFLPTLGVFYDMHRADHASGRGGLTPTCRLARGLGRIARRLGGRGGMNCATDSIPPDVGRSGPGTGHSLRTTFGRTFLNGGHRDFRLCNFMNHF